MSRANKGSCFEWTKRSKNNLTSQTRIIYIYFETEFNTVIKMCTNSVCILMNAGNHFMTLCWKRAMSECMHMTFYIFIMISRKHFSHLFVPMRAVVAACFFFIQSSIHFYCAWLVICWSCEHEDGCYWQATQLTNSTVS